MTKSFVNPTNLFASEQYGFSQVAVVRGGTTVYLAGQVGWSKDREIGAPNDLGAQARAALTNVELALQEVGGTRHDVVAMRVYIRNDYIHDDTPIQKALKEFFAPGALPVGTWIGVPALAHPDFLVEIEATAVIDDEGPG